MITIIVPIYNVENYIKECIDSILNQSYTNFELLLIDDGSIDSSFNICKEYESIDKKVKVYHKINGGVSSARNMGIEKAKGEWITFIDSDDYIGHDYLSKLIPQDSNTLYDFSLVEGFIKHNIIKHFFKNTPIQNIPLENVISAICGEKGLCLAPWGKLFRKEIINKYHIRFTEGLSFCEDLIFCFTYFKYIQNSIFVGNDTSYYYREVNNSLTHKIVDYKQVRTALQLQYDDFLYYNSRFPNERIIIKHFSNMLSNCILRITEQIFYNNKTSISEQKEIIKECKNYIDSLSIYKVDVKLPTKQMLKYYSIKYFPFIFIKCLYSIK